MDSLPSGAASAAGGYPDSVESSPRSRGGESWDEPFPSSAAAPKLRLMCSYGGRIVPRPTDKSLCYLGGETRIVVVDRHSTLADLTARLSRSLLGGRPFSLKYQLPNEDLDSLISVATDEDLDNMIEEYDRILASAAAAKPDSTRSNRLRLFLFPSKPESAPSSIGSLLDDSKSETWFVDALNNAMGMGGGLPRGLSTDSASVNCLLGLEEDSSTHSRGGGGGAAPAGPVAEPDQLVLRRPDSSGKLASVPDSPMMETASSFGSTSSAPSLSNLPPIRVRADDRPQDPRVHAAAAMDEHFAHMNLGQRHDDGFKDGGFVVSHHQQLQHQAPPPPAPIPLPTTSASTPTISPTDNPNRVFSDDEKSEKSEHGGVRKQPPAMPKPTTLDAPIQDPRTMYYQERAPTASAAAVNQVLDLKRDAPISVSDQSYRVPIQVPDPSYMMPAMHQDQLHQHQHQHQQQQFVHATPQYIHHHPTGTMVPIQSYYQMPSHQLQQSQQSHPYDQQVPMYFLPVRQNPAAYNLAVPPPNMADPSASMSSKPVPLPNSVLPPRRPAAPSTSPVMHVAADQAHPYASSMAYHVMHPSQSVAPQANYGYDYSDPSHPQVYYTQATSQQALPPQYQAVNPVAPADSPTSKQTRAS